MNRGVLILGVLFSTKKYVWQPYKAVLVLTRIRTANTHDFMIYFSQRSGIGGNLEVRPLFRTSTSDFGNPGKVQVSRSKSLWV